MELFKEAVPKVARVAVLYDPALRTVYTIVKEVLPVAARALGLTLRSWQTRAAEDFDEVFAAISKWRPDGLYVPPNAGRSVRLHLKRYPYRESDDHFRICDLLQDSGLEATRRTKRSTVLRASQARPHARMLLRIPWRRILTYVLLSNGKILRLTARAAYRKADRFVKIAYCAVGAT